MLLADDDYWHLASSLLRKHGADTGRELERRLAQAQEQGDDEGRAIWLEVARALHELLREPSADDRVN
jgi:hypothetical protein